MRPTRLLMLSVLSGEVPVTEAIREAGISRGLYYQLETKALQAMMTALSPTAQAEDGSGPVNFHRQLEELERKLKQAEQEKRRAERLLFLTRKVVRPGPLKSGKKGPKGPRSSTASGRGPSTRSTSPENVPPSSPLSPNPSGTGESSR